MRSFGTVLGLLVVAAGGYFVYHAYLSSRGQPSAPPQQQIDVVGVQADLLSMAQAERQYLATRGTYASIEQLMGDGLITGGVQRRGYTYTATVDGGTSFTIVGTPTEPEKAGWPVLSIDQTLQITRR